MKAQDVMTTPVVCVTEDTNIADVTRLMIRAHLSGLPVVDSKDAVVGIVTEGDLLRHESAGVNAPEKRSRFVEFFMNPTVRAEEYIKQHARTAKEIMTPSVVTVTPETSLADIADALEKNKIKRVPVVKGGRVVGLVSRADLLREISRARVSVPVNDDDNVIRDRVRQSISDSGVSAAYLGVFVDDGEVELSGLTSTNVERDAIVLAAESTAGVRKVVNSIRLPVIGTE